MIEKNLRFHLNLANGVRADRVDEELLMLGKQAGLYQLGIGFESGDQVTLDAMQKGLKDGAATGRHVMQLIRKVGGLETVGFFMFGANGDTEESMEKTLTAIKHLQSADIACEVVTAGGTGTYNMTGSYPYITEIQPGSYVFMDAQYSRVLDDFGNSGTLLATVISRPTKDRLVVDCGMKGLSTDQWPPIIKSVNGATVLSASDEHLTIQLESDESRQLRPGDKVELIPGHNDTTVNLHTDLFAIRNNKLEAVWPVSARAMIR